MPSQSRNHQTLASYERIALDYAESTKGSPSGVVGEALRTLVDSLPPAGAVLELGSGPGWDADFLESHGLRVRRTDATTAFRDFQRSRGKEAHPLNAITDRYTDDLWPAYEGVVALFVLQHIERGDAGRVLEKVSAALRPGGAFLASVREGSGEEWEVGTSGNRYHVTMWDEPAFTDLLRGAGLEPVSMARVEDEEGPWLVVVARKTTAS